MDLDTSRVAAILQLLDNPQNELKIIHVAGTNGKGSVCSFLESILIESCHNPDRSESPTPKSPSKLKVGKFNSPHLISVCDSVRINRNPISEEDLTRIRNKVHNLAAEHKIALTNFESLTVTMFIWFKESRVDICIVEVGLGGALDATNVLEQPLACVFTSIGIDHEAILGNSLEEIAAHKAGILKKNGNAVISQQKETSAIQSLVDQCKKNKVNYVCSGVAQLKEMMDHSSEPRLVEYTTKILMTTYEVECPLQGDFQLINLACALDVIDLLKAVHKDLFLIPAEAVSLGCSKTTWPGRLEWVEAAGLGQILVDGAHNPAAAQALSDYLSNIITTQLSDVEDFFHVHWIFGATKGKCIDKIISILLKSLADELNLKQRKIKSDISLVGFSQPDEMPWICSWPTDALQSELLELPDAHFNKIQQFGNISDALKTLKAEYPNLPSKQHLVVVTGSLYLVADLFRFLDPVKAHRH